MSVDSAVPVRNAVQVRGGRLLPAPDPAAALREGADLVWAALTDPSVEVLAEAVRVLGLPTRLVAEIHAGMPDRTVPGEPAYRRRARLVEDGPARAVVLLPASYDEAREEVHLGLLTLLVSGAAVLSVAHGPAPDLDRLRARAAVEDEHSARLVESVVAAVLEGYDVVLEQVDDDVTEVETQVFSSGRSSHAQRIYGLKRETLQLQRAVAPLLEVVGRLQCSSALHERVMRVAEHVDRLDALLDSVLSADLAQVGVRQNEDQRTISAWAAIALVPTVVAGVYGMNFEHMPELSWTYGYPAALGLIAAVCWGLHRGFRRNGWLGSGRR